MRLLFLGPNLGPGGAERQTSILLPALRQRGHDARLIALDGGGPFAEPLEAAGVPLEVLDMRNQLDVLPLLRSPILRRFRPDVVVTRGVNGLYVGRLVAITRHARLVFNDHRQVGLAQSRRREAMTRLLTRSIDLVIAVTPGQSQAWLERGLDRNRFTIIPNGVDTPHITDDRTAIRGELGLPTEAVVAVSVSSLRPEKRVGDFADAVLAARERSADLVGVIVGDGPDWPLIERARRESPCGIVALGQRTDVARVLRAADIFVNASEREALPMAILEAMASGLPVIATPVGGVPELVQDGQSGVLVSPRAPTELAAALERLAGDPTLRAEMGRRGTELHRDRWSAGRMVDGYERALSPLAR